METSSAVFWQLTMVSFSQIKKNEIPLVDYYTNVAGRTSYMP